jgi:protoporphyrinogen oxidase
MGVSIRVVEKGPTAGGLCRSICKDGYTFDLGGHRLHSEKQWIIDKVKEILDEEMLYPKRKSRILLRGKFLHYPLKASSALFSFGLINSFKMLLSYFVSKLKAKQIDNKKNDLSFEDWIVGRFGQSLYEIYFEPYTEKVWGLPCKDISADWAAERISPLNLIDVIKRIFIKPKKFKGRPAVSQFYYPAKGGIGRITDKIVETLKASGDELLFQTEPVEIRYENNEVKSVLINNGKSSSEITSDHFISTIPLTTLVSILKPAPPKEIIEAANHLCYRAVICVFIVVNKPLVTDDTWIYFPEKAIFFGRSHEPKNWSKENVREGKTSLCLEIFCSENDKFWQMPDKEVIGKVLDDLDRVGLIKKDEIGDSFMERVPNAYPVYQMGYKEHLSKVTQYFSQFKNLHILGRTGEFRYLNMDSVVEVSVKKARDLYSNAKSSL